MAKDQGPALALAVLCASLLAVCAPASLHARAVDSELGHSCSKSSPQLSECVKEGLAAIISEFKNGNTELGIPPLDPMEVPFLSVTHEDTNVSLDLAMKNISITGFTDIKLAKVKIDLDDVNKLEVTGKTPALHVFGQYISEGNIVTFPLHSAGTFSINMMDVTSSWVVYLKEMTRHGTKYLQIEGFDIDMMPISISFRPAAQMDGDNSLGEAVDVILNENSSEIYSLIKGQMSSVFSGFLTELANQVLSQVPEHRFLTP